MDDLARNEVMNAYDDDDDIPVNPDDAIVFEKFSEVKKRLDIATDALHAASDPITIKKMSEYNRSVNILKEEIDPLFTAALNAIYALKKKATYIVNTHRH